MISALQDATAKLAPTAQKGTSSGNQKIICMIFKVLAFLISVTGAAQSLATGQPRSRVTLYSVTHVTRDGTARTG